MPYIDSEALKKKIFPYGMPDNGNCEINAKSVMVVIKNAPAVDAVEVVRCKDCQYSYWERYNETSSAFKCANHDGLFGEVDFHDFCSYGETR